MMLTPRGITVAVAGIVMWVCARFLGSPGLEVVAIGLAALPFVAGLFLRASNKPIAATRHLSDSRVTPGTRVTVRLDIANPTPATTSFLLLEDRLPPALGQQLRELARGDFLERAMNVLAFGLPGVGKSHAACAVGHALVEAGNSVLFSPTYQLVQELLAAKRELDLPRALRKLDAFDLIILDDIGYVQQSADEIEVLFTLMAERYERRSMLITSNLVFSAWDQIFKNPMTTAAAIDRLVHHSVILEFAVPSYRTEKARKNGAADDNYPKPPKSREK